jgi:hypothetical protein
VVLRSQDGEPHHGGMGRRLLPLQDGGSLDQTWDLGRVAGGPRNGSSLWVYYAPMLLGKKGIKIPYIGSQVPLRQTRRVAYMPNGFGLKRFLRPAVSWDHLTSPRRGRVTPPASTRYGWFIGLPWPGSDEPPVLCAASSRS